MGRVAADEVGSLKDNSNACKWSPQSADAVFWGPSYRAADVQ